MKCIRPDGTYPHPYCCRGQCHESWPERGVYIGCGECGHWYRTRWHLLIAYIRKARQLDYPWRIALRRWRPSRIFFCQCCIHDF